MKKNFTMKLIPGLMLMAFGGASSAAGFALIEQNAGGLSSAYAGSAAIADNAATIFFNPAGMTKLQARELSVGLSAVKPSFKYTDKGSTWAPPGVPAAAVPMTGTSTRDAGDWAAIPNAYMSWALNKDLHLGVGFSAPFGLKTEYDPTWVGQFQAIKFDIKTYNINPSIAYRLNDKVSLGFGLSWQKMEAEYERQAATIVSIPGVPLATARALAQGTRVLLEADDDNWGWNAGVLIDLSPSTRLGVSYRSTVEHTLEGTLTATPSTLAARVNAKADIRLPDMLILSGVQTLSDRWTMLGDLSWTGWSKIQKVDIVRTSSGGTATTQPGSIAQTLDADFRDTWRVALGGIYKYSGNWDLRLGIAYDQAPVRSIQQRLVSLPDNDRLWLTTGGQWKLSPTARLDLGAAYLFIRDTDIDNDQSASARGRVTGSYDSSVWILGAQYSRSF